MLRDVDEGRAGESSDLRLLRRTFALAQEARGSGNLPFGALLADPNGTVLLEARSRVISEHDCTAHAETTLVRMACRELSPEALAAATFYSSTEPCAMCSGAIYWAGLTRVVFGVGLETFRQLTPDDSERGPQLSCRDVFASGGRSVAVSGPLLEDEGLVVHEGFWTP
jgi:tRNA(Arg) A34 adenosine deaminase TadA